MILIVVKKEWLDEIAGLADGLLVAKHSASLGLMYAGKSEMEYPFVYADVARTSKEGKTFLPIHIPVDAIRGIFDMTDAEKQKLGF